MPLALRAGPVALVIALGLASPVRAQDNVLIVIADDLGVDNINAYAESLAPPPTPNIDALAARGVLFRNAWANPLCSPSRANLMTGRRAFRTGVGKFITPPETAGPRENVLGLEEMTIPELLDQAGSGYAHAAIGKWHLGDARNGGALGPNRAGWSHFSGFLYGWSQYYRWPRTVNGATATSTAYQTSQIADDAIDWLATAPEPWVCHLAFGAPHEPYHEPPAHLHTQNLTGLEPMVTPTPFYRAAVEALDSELGRVLASLPAGVMQRTNVVFLSDNGTPGPVTQWPLAPTHAKGTPYEGGVNVPLVVAGPAVASPGREEAALVEITDVFATVAELCGVAPTVPIIVSDSRSMAPYLRDPLQAPLRQFVLAEEFVGDVVTAYGSAAIRDDAFKLIRWYRPVGTSDELYDLMADPLERINLLEAGATPAELQRYQVLSDELVRARKLQGSVRSFGGVTCAGTAGMPFITASGEPRPGGSYVVGLKSAGPMLPAGLLLGVSATSFAGLPLPLLLAPLGGAPGCFLHTSTDLSFGVTTDARGEASVSIALPAFGTLAASAFFHSWVVVDPGASALGLTTSDGAAVTVGAPIY
ncbi:MAG: sulfatase-like hydrolase/transferase [Planctomycetota bacterium]